MHDQMLLLSLRMSAAKLQKVPHFDEGSESSLETLAVMTSQDSAYRCRDYLGRRKAARPLKNSSPFASSFEPLEDSPDMVCREKMCEWSYRVCDHFRTNREIVAFAFSFLDRFVDRCSCDRTAFKLASMTCLYMSTKIFNNKQISIDSLADLSRGEFDVKHISEMEKVILETLDWRMNPPTAQSFIERLCALIPLDDKTAIRAIYQRAIFLAELSLYDYEFVTQEKYAVALACILNAMEGMDGMNEEHIYRTLPLQFIAKLRFNLCVDLHPATLEHCQERLWFLYGCSAQLQHDDILPLHIHHHQEDKPAKTTTAKTTTTTHPSDSPISVDGPY